MPKINMADMPGNIKPIDHSARAAKIPNDFGMGKSRTILKASEVIIQGSAQLGKSIMNYNKVLQDKEDDLAIQQAENAYYKKQLDLQNRMRENPNQNTEFGKWAEDVDAEWEAEEAQYTERMSENARQRYSLAMSKLRYKSVQETNTISTMARTANLYNGEKTLINDDIRTGNFDSAISRLDNAQNGEIKLFSDEEVRKYKEEIIPLSRELKEIEIAENNNDFTMIDKLKSVNENGSYQNFVKIPADQRRQLIQRLEGKQASIEDKNYNAFLTSFVKGTPMYDMDKINELHEKGELSDEQYLSMANVRSEYDKNLKNIEKQNIKAKAEASNKRGDYVLGKIRTKEISMNPAENALQKHNDYKFIQKNFTDIQQQAKLLQEVDKIYAEALEGKGIWKTKEGEYVFDFLNDNYRNKNGEFKGLNYETAFWSKEINNTGNQEFQKEHYYELAEYAAGLLNKGYSGGEVIQMVKDKRKALTDADVKNIMTSITNRPQIKTKTDINKQIMNEKDK